MLSTWFRNDFAGRCIFRVCLSAEIAHLYSTNPSAVHPVLANAHYCCRIHCQSLKLALSGRIQAPLSTYVPNTAIWNEPYRDLVRVRLFPCSQQHHLQPLPTSLVSSIPEHCG